MLYDLRMDHRKSKDFIEHCLSKVTSAEIIGKDRYNTPTSRINLRGTALYCIVADCAAKNSPENAERRGILHAYDILDMLELVELATKDSQEEMTTLLSSWLTNDECDIWYMGERRLGEISKEIKKEWLQQQLPQ